VPWLARIPARQRSDILVVCTGNVCRSPYIAAVLHAALPALRIAAAGTAPLLGALPDDQVRRALAERGISADFEPARPLTRQLVRDARLVVAATRLHRAEIVTRQPRAVEHTFTLKELARVIQPSDDDLDAVVVRARAAARADDLRDYDDDLADPFGLDWPAYEKMAAEVDAALAVLIPALREGPDPA